MVITHFPYGPTAYFSLHNVVLRHDIPDRGTVSEQYPHLIFNGFSSSLGQRVCSLILTKKTTNILKYLFPVPKQDSKRVMTFSNSGDYISFRHHVFVKVKDQVQLAEVGPRFEMRCNFLKLTHKVYEIKLGTMDLTQAESEWVLRPYQRTARKREVL